MSDGSLGITLGYIMLGIIVLGLIIGIIATKVTKEAEHLEYAIGFSITIGLLLVWLPLMFGYENRRVYYESYETVLYKKIESVDRGSDIEGRFSLFSGYVESNVAYFFYVKTEHGYELKQVTVKNDNKVYLVEDNTRTPQIIQKKEVGERAYTQIIVPTGTIVKDYRG